MAQGATISINVPNSVAQTLKVAATQLQRMDRALTAVIQKQVAYSTAMASSGKTSKAFSQAMLNSNRALSSYAVNAAPAASGATSALSQQLKTAAAWTKQMGIGLYVVGGAATQVARPLMALSMIFQTYKEMPFESDRVERWGEEVVAHFKWLGRAIKSTMVTAIKYVKLFGWAMLNAAAKVPILGRAITGLHKMISTMGGLSAVSMGWIGIILAATAGLAIAAKSIADNFSEVSEHIQRAISVSAIAQDQFGSLTETIFDLREQLGIFTTEEVASMVERMAYAGAIGEGFRETAMAIGQIAYVTGMEMAEITRDMARLTSQTGAGYKELANVILRTFAQASITYEETVEAFQQAGMLLREDLGMTTAELGAIVVQLEKFGYTGTRAATAIRSLAARSSELREGLRGSKEIFEDLGVTKAVEQFKSGQIALDELIMTFGAAGASYGHMVNIFNRRAGVAAAAIAEFPEKFQNAAAQINQSTTEITSMFDDLRQTYQGVQDQAKSARSGATQQWAYALRHIGRAITNMQAKWWDFIQTLGEGFAKLPSLAAVIGHGFLTAMQYVGEFVEYVIGGLEWVIEKALQLGAIVAKIIPGVSGKALKELGDKLKKHREKLWEESKYTEHQREKFMSAWSDLLGGEGVLEVKAQVQYKVDQFERAAEEYEESVAGNIEELVKFRDALHPDFLEDLGNEIIGLVGNLEFASENLDIFVKGLEESYKRTLALGQEFSWKGAWGKVTTQVGGTISDLAKLGQASTYLEDKFNDVVDELEDMFGLSRSVQRRHGAVVQGTGERVGQVRGEVGGGGGETVQALKDFLGEDYDFARKLVKNMSGFTGEFTPMLLEMLSTTGEGEIEGWDDMFERFINMVIPGDKFAPELPTDKETYQIGIKPQLEMFGSEAPIWDELNKEFKGAIRDFIDNVNEEVNGVNVSEPVGQLETVLGNKFSKEKIKGLINVNSALGEKGFSGDFADVIDKLGLEKEDLSPAAQRYVSRWVSQHNKAKNKQSGLPETAENYASKFDEEHKNAWQKLSGFFSNLFNFSDKNTGFIGKAWQDWKNWGSMIWGGFKKMDKMILGFLDATTGVQVHAANLSEEEKERLKETMKKYAPEPQKKGPLQKLKDTIHDALDFKIPWGDWNPIEKVKTKISGALKGLKWKWPEWKPIKAVKSGVQGALKDLEFSWPGSLSLPENPLSSIRKSLKTIDGISIPSSPLKSIKKSINDLTGLEIPKSPLKSVKDALKGIGIKPSEWNPANWIKSGVRSAIEGVSWIFSDEFDPVSLIAGGVENAISNISWWLSTVDEFNPLKLLASGIKSAIKGIIWGFSQVDGFNPVKMIAGGISNAIGNIDWVWPKEFTPIQALKKNVKAMLDFNFGWGDDNPVNSLKERLRKQIEQRDDSSLLGSIADIMLNALSAPKVEAAEGKVGYTIPSFDKLLDSAQLIANASEKLEKAAGNIQGNAEATTNIERQTKNIVTVNLDQSFQNTFDIDTGGAEGKATEEMIRQAVERAVRKLERSVRDSVDPEALEKLVVEQIEDQVKENKQSSKSRPGDWSE